MIVYDEVKADSVGKWPSILTHFGIDVGNGRHQACPMCGGKDRFRFDNKDGTGTWICNQCGAGDGIGLLERVWQTTFSAVCQKLAPVVGTLPESAMQVEKAISPKILRGMLEKAKRIHTNKTGAGYKYLVSRGLSEAIPVGLRFSNHVWEPETKKEQRAILAIFQAPDSTGVTVHRTYLDVDGNKLAIQAPKKTMPTVKPMTGGAVRLYQLVDGMPLGIAEGIETAIAAHILWGVPVWAVLSTALMGSFRPPPEVTHMIVFGDNDRHFAGQRAAYTLANRLATECSIVSAVEIPDVEGDDWCDVLNKRTI